MFQDVIGHRRLVSLLSRSIRQDSLPPSLIFGGPEGVGKRLVAVSAAQAINCPDACGTCSTCSRIARGIHPDVLLVEPGDTGSIKIEQVRDVIERSAYRPFEGRRRVVIVNDADALVPAAQNALLKTLEEPPSSSVFILVTSKPGMLLPTVRSRCVLLRFQPLDAEDVVRALLKLGRSEDEARAVAALADGSIGHGLAASAGDLNDARELAARVLIQAAGVPGGPGGSARLEAARSLVARSAGSAAEDRAQLADHFRAMASLLRDVEVGATSAGEALANRDMRPALDKLTAFRGGRGVRAFAAIDRAVAALEANAGVKIVADWLVMQL